MRAYLLDYSFWVACGVLTIVRLATVVPNAPGNIGLGNIACVMAMKLFDLGENDAKTFSIILFGALTLPLLLGGAVATALTGSKSANSAIAPGKASTPTTPALPIRPRHKVRGTCFSLSIEMPSWPGQGGSTMPLSFLKGGIPAEIRWGRPRGLRGHSSSRPVGHAGSLRA